MSSQNERTRRLRVRLGRIRGVVRDDAERPFEGVAVFIREGPEHPDIAAETNADGEFDLGSLSPGDYELLVRSPAGEELAARVPVRVGKVAFVDMWLNRYPTSRQVTEPLDSFEEI